MWPSLASPGEERALSLATLCSGVREGTSRTVTGQKAKTTALMWRRDYLTSGTRHNACFKAFLPAL